MQRRRRKVLGLLAYLAVTSRAHGRDELAEFLYPDRDRDRAFADLRQSLSYLREYLGARWIESDAGTVSLPAARGLLVDVTEFHALVGRSRAAASKTSGDAGLALLAKAARLYRGPFLSGFYLKDSPAFEQWQAGEEETLRREYTSVLERLIDCHRRRGEVDAAISWAQAAVDLDPLEEASQRRLMALLAAAGQRSQALRQYERCRSLLAQSLETEPDEETEALRAEVAGGGIAVEKRPVSPVTPATGTAPEPGPPPSAGMVFLLASTGRVGHDGEMRSVFPTGPAAINAAIKLLTTSTARRPRGRGARRTPPADHAVLSQLATVTVVRAAETGREPVHGSVQVVSRLYYLVMRRATLDGIRAAFAPTIFTIDGITRDPVPGPIGRLRRSSTPRP